MKSIVSILLCIAIIILCVIGIGGIDFIIRGKKSIVSILVEKFINL